jgi:protease-4
VWTGAQALEIGLVDTLGDFETALATAKELANLEPEQEYTIVQMTPPRQELLPRPFPIAEPTWRVVLDVLQNLARERVWALAPWTVRVRG